MTSLDTLFDRYRTTRSPRDLGAVFDHSAAELLRLATHLVGHRADAEDIVQTTFLDVMRFTGRHERGTPVHPWLLGILANHARMSRRRARRRLKPERVRQPEAAVDPLDAASVEEIHRDLRQRVDKLPDRYRAVLWRWNEQLNLTRHTTFDKFVSRDVVDSLQLAELLRQGERVLDIGTGGGVPGLVLAICRPDLRVSVCESTQKKARVVQAIVQELGLKVQVYACRAEEVLELQTFDTLTARGVAALAKILTWVEPYWEAFDR